MTKPKDAVPVNGSTTSGKPICGLVMPISALDGCTEQHWIEVKEIFTEAIESVDFTAMLVSYADDVGIIQKRIIQNLYDNPIVVCDVSGKNPNVMFELGMRLAFDKPTIIVKDDKTTYSFDTSPIEHVEYPRDLRFSRIVAFKKVLAEKIRATYQKAKDDPHFTPFLKHFGKFTVAKLDSTEVSKDEFIMRQLAEMRELIIRDREMMTLRELELFDMHRREEKRREELRHRNSKSVTTASLTDEELINDAVAKEVLRVVEELSVKNPALTATPKGEAEIVERVESRLLTNGIPSPLPLPILRDLIRRQVRRTVG